MKELTNWINAHETWKIAAVATVIGIFLMVALPLWFIAVGGIATDTLAYLLS